MTPYFPRPKLRRRPAARRALAALAGIVAGAGEATAAAVDFGREILPILANNCFHCRGPDERERKAGLRLDTEAGLRSAGKSGATAVVPGRSGESELFLRISSAHEDEAMPPRNAKEKLTPPQIELLRRWSDEGARWGNFWAFDSSRRPAVPAVRVHAARGRTPSDAFVRARLEREKLAPSPEADRRTLLRRLSLDLPGLPSAPADVEAFVNDARPDAYERPVEALLASPHIGERWGGTGSTSRGSRTAPATSTTPCGPTRISAAIG
jgi:hypothetical protein